MDYRIIEAGPITVIGKSKKFLAADDSTAMVPEYWSECMQSGLYKRLTKDICKSVPGAVTGGESLGICVGEKDGFTYIIGAEKPEGEIPEGLSAVTIPSSTWAVFECKGAMPKSIQELWKRIYEEWFPSTGYEQADVPDFEVYLPGDMDSKDYRSQIWIPVIKKRK